MSRLLLQLYRRQESEYMMLETDQPTSSRRTVATSSKQSVSSKAQAQQSSLIPQPSSSPDRLPRRRYVRTAQDLNLLPEIPSFIGRKRDTSSDFESSSPKRRARERPATTAQTRSSGRELFQTPARTVNFPGQPPAVGPNSRISSLEAFSPIELKPYLVRMEQRGPDDDRRVDNPAQAAMGTTAGGTHSGANPERQELGPNQGNRPVAEEPPPDHAHQEQTGPGGPEVAVVRYRKKDWERDAILICSMIARIHEPEVAGSVARLIRQDVFAQAKGAERILTKKKVEEYRKSNQVLLPGGPEHWRISDENVFLQFLRKFADGWDQDQQPVEEEVEPPGTRSSNQRHNNVSTHQPAVAQDQVEDPGMQLPGTFPRADRRATGQFTLQPAGSPVLANPLRQPLVEDFRQNQGLRRERERADLAEQQLREQRERSNQALATYRATQQRLEQELADHHRQVRDLEVRMERANTRERELQDEIQQQQTRIPREVYVSQDARVP